MSLRPRRALAISLSVFIVVMMTVWAPAMAFADSPNGTPPTTPPGQSETPPGNSAEAPGQVAKTEPVTSTVVADPPADPGKSEEAPGQTKTETTTTTTTPPPTSNAGGNSGSNGGGSSNANENSNAGGNSDKGSTTTGGNTSTGGNAGSHQQKPSSGVPEGKGDGPTNGVGGNCDGDPSGGSDTGNGANGGTMYDHTCQPEGKAPNGNGGGEAKGKPCTGCVGNADDKNPPGQSKVGPGGADHNKGYECENPRWQNKNNGVGKGNPAHSGCSPVIQYDCAGHALPNTHDHTVTGDKLCYTATEYDCVGGVGHEKSLNHNHGKSGDGLCEGSSKTYDCVGGAGHELPNSHNHTATGDGLCAGPPPIVDCDGDMIDDNVDPDITSCTPPPPSEDCDGDGVPDNLDTDLSECEPTERPEFCPGTTTPMPEDGVCDEVLGEIIDRDPKPVFPGGPVVAGEVLGKPEAKPAVAASVLPFTGGNMLPFLIVSMALMGIGGVSLRRRVVIEDDAA